MAAVDVLVLLAAGTLASSDFVASIEKCEGRFAVVCGLFLHGAYAAYMTLHVCLEA